VTGVQLEVGTVATPFDLRPFTTEVLLCQRYYWKSYGLEVKPGTNVTSGFGGIWTSGPASGQTGGSIALPAAMRTAIASSSYDNVGALNATSIFNGGAWVNGQPAINVRSNGVAIGFQGAIATAVLINFDITIHSEL
jgi:hypothetical protein